MATDIQIQIKSKIDTFAAELERLIRLAAIAAVGDALGTTGKGPKHRGAGAIAKSAPAKAGKAKRGRPAGGRLVRRSAEAINATADRVLGHIKAHPGQRSEEIRAGLNIAKNVWAPAIARLLEEKRVTKKGVKRSTTYAAK